MFIFPFFFLDSLDRKELLPSLKHEPITQNNPKYSIKRLTDNHRSVVGLDRDGLFTSSSSVLWLSDLVDEFSVFLRNTSLDSSSGLGIEEFSEFVGNDLLVVATSSEPLELFESFSSESELFLGVGLSGSSLRHSCDVGTNKIFKAI